MGRSSLLHAHLATAARGTPGPEAAVRAHVTAALVTALGCLREQISALEEQIATQPDRHPDAAVFTSLPKAGVVRAARLLVEIGDARGRYPTPESLINAAGAAPSTRQSGKVKIVSFLVPRWARIRAPTSRRPGRPATRVLATACTAVTDRLSGQHHGRGLRTRSTRGPRTEATAIGIPTIQ